ncbi:hypothetical protein [Chryseobacterium sp. JV274]|nr:hypothetical protein [Chryseobacterium sp. JV274]CAD0220360.1 conserved protein of unknown function [Chryseobacterium sp. JV274]
MKEFIKDCLLFQHKDRQMRIIGVTTWLSILGLIGLFYWILF